MSNYIRLISGTLVDASFGGTDLSDKKFYCYDFVKGLMPRQKEITIDIPGTPGIVQLDKKFVSRPIKLYGYMDCSSHADLISKINSLAEFLYNDADQQLILSNETDRYYNAQYIDYTEIWRRKDYAKIVLVFNCNDPFAYAITADTPADQNIIDNDKTWTVQNLGQYYSYPVVTITFNQAQTHIYIINNTLGSVGFDISKSFVLNDVLVIDSKAMTIRLNGESATAGFGDVGEGRAEFLVLMAAMNEGNNELQIGSTDPSIKVSVNVWFRKVYL